jgi:allantoinase
VLTFGLHPHLVGVAHRASFFAKCLDLLLARDDVQFVTGSEIADWFVQVDAGPAFG